MIIADFTLTTARRQLISVDATSYYHCVSRCVRRSFLCGEDELTNISYEHRRGWIEQKIYALTQVYCIDVCAYAIMSNHYHLVLHINKDKAVTLSPHEVVEHWSREHKLPAIIQRWLNKQLTSQVEEVKCAELIEVWRERLWSLSWFMKELNYDIACRANREDSCTGHFWESRFKSQALLDEKALAAAMVYVDLNPIRAGVAKTPETSEFTSIKARINALNNNVFTAPCLHPFVGSSPREGEKGIPLRLMDYIELVDWSARIIREGKANLDKSLPPILTRFNFSQTRWITICSALEKTRSSAIGSYISIEKAKIALNKKKMQIYQLE